MSSSSQTRLSKLLSLMLRHRPDEFGVSLDPHGFAHTNDVLGALQERFPWVTQDDIDALVNNSEKQRFEIAGDKIRAKYGHSFPVELDLPAVTPPEYLYQAVPPEAAGQILAEGLTPRDRRYVHLSLSSQIARELGQKIGPDCVVLRILAEKASAQGEVRFFDCGPVVLTEFVPPDCIEVVTECCAPSVGASYGRKLKLRKR